MTTRVTLIPGDGIGPEITEAAVRIIDAAGANIEWEIQEAGMKVFAQHNKAVPDSVLESIRRNKTALKGPLTTLVGKGFASANVTLRKELDLYANLRPVRNLAGIPSRYENIDLIIVRENTEDLYAGIEHVVVPGVTASIKIITSLASERIARFAFEYARRRHRRKVTAVHKANIMKLTDGLFLESARRVAAEYPDIEFEDQIVDALCMKLVMDPHRFDVLLLSNLYGDIVSDLAAGLVGGLGVVPGANYGDQYAVFEAVHGSAPDIAGKGIANPLAVLFSAIMMLRHLNRDDIADRIKDSAFAVMKAGRVRTPDLGGQATTAQFADAIIAELK
ncbi:MAG TPA: isocitrate dehydrogenase (NAD(+)) [bacterium]|nr:isocitrate dehydrogenase (NAD(+)) [bacterium]